MNLKMNKLKTSRTHWSAGLLLACLFLGSCSVSDSPFGDPEIRLTADVDGVSGKSSTRVAYGNGGSKVPEGGLPVHFARLDASSSEGNFPTYDLTTPLAATLTTKGAIDFAVKQLYLDNGFRSRFVGWHPVGTFSAGEVSFALNGATDVMLTNERDGSLAAPFGTPESAFTFAHCLAHLQVVSYVYSDGDVAKYGKITAIRVADQPTSCTLSLPTAVPVFSKETSAFVLKNPADDTDMLPVSLTGATSEKPVSCGSLLFAPQGGRLNLVVDTENYADYPLTVALSGTAVFEAGKTYTVRLRFGGNKVIFPEVLVSPWTDNTKSPVLIDIDRI